MNAGDDARVDLTGPRELLTTALANIQRLHGRRHPVGGAGRDASAQLAELTRELLYLGHLCDSARVQVLDEYHLAKGYTAHIRPTEEPG